MKPSRSLTVSPGSPISRFTNVPLALHAASAAAFGVFKQMISPPCRQGGHRRRSIAGQVVLGPPRRIGEGLVGLAQLAQPLAGLAADRLEANLAPVRVPDLVRRRLPRDAEHGVVIPGAHGRVLSRLCSIRHSSILPWSPESRTSGTRHPRNSAGRV